MWDTFAEYFGVKVAPPGDEPLDIEALMRDKGPVWDEIVQKHGLKVSPGSRGVKQVKDVK